MAKFGPPEQFDFSQPAEWPVWRRRFDRFQVASKLYKERGEVQVNSLLYAMGREAEPIYESFVYDGDGENPEFDYKTVIEKFDEHFLPKRNIIHDRACFHKRMQKPREIVKAFVRSLYELAQHCEFGIMKDEQIRDRIVIGIQDNEVSLKLQLEPNLTLEKAIHLAQQSEQIKKQSVDMRADCLVNAVRRKAQQQASRKASNVGRQWQNSPKYGDSDEDWRVTLPVNGSPVEFKIDTGLKPS